jgi:hypothetical protein
MCSHAYGPCASYRIMPATILPTHHADQACLPRNRRAVSLRRVSPVARPAAVPQGVPAALPYRIRRRLSSTRHRRTLPCCGPHWQVAPARWERCTRWGHGRVAAGGAGVIRSAQTGQAIYLPL